MLSRIKQIKRSSWVIMALIVALLASFNQISRDQKAILRLEAKRDANIALSGHHLWREFDTLNIYVRDAWQDFEAGDLEQTIANLNQTIPRLNMLDSLVDIYNQAISHRHLQSQRGLYAPRLLSLHITVGWSNDLALIRIALIEQGKLNAAQIKQFKAIQFDIDRFAYHFSRDVLVTGDPQQLEYALTHWCGTLQTEDAKLSVGMFGDSSLAACNYVDELLKQTQR
ncbi:MAG: hypothetical protein LCH85_19765 [Chloroflexi bacterium]|nr:hypothetical protein [Chloroflexota bacterium]